MHLNGIFFFEKFVLKTVEAKVIIFTQYIEHDETMSLNKFQRSRLAFDLSVKVAYIGVPSIY